MKIFLLVSPSPLTASGSGSAPEGLLPRRESLWLGEGRECLPAPPSVGTGAGRQGVRVALRLAQGACMVSLSNHPPPLLPLKL